MHRRKLSRGARRALVAVAVPVAVLGSATAFAGQSQLQAEKDQAALTEDGLGAATVVYKGRSSFSGQHGSSFDHLPAARENIEVVSKLSPTSQGPVVPGQIADLAVYRNAAYLMSWNRGTECSKGGFYSVDISDPAAPKELAFVPAAPGTYHGEGAHAITMNTASFSGDVLGVNNERCTSAGLGGFDLYDVSNPAEPKPLVVGAGDRSTASGGTRANANSSHSTFLWQAGDKAYAVIVDNVEFSDVDIFDITDPRNPVQIGDYDLLDMFPEIEGNSANGNSIFLHDMVVKQIGDRYIMLVSYWDAGYVQLDVTDPTNPTLVGDTDFGQTDPLTGKQPPEGNAHQAEFSADNRFILAADEDFSPFRLPNFRMTTGPNAGQYPAGEFGFAKPIATREDNTLNGPTIFGGYGCDASAPIPPRSSAGFTLDPGEEAIVVVQRGPVQDPNDPYDACTFQEKAENAEAAGYDAILIANHHVGSNEGDNPDATVCGSGTGVGIHAVCIGHRMMHLLFNEQPEYTVPYATPKDPDEPDIGAQGEKVSGTSEFDGWGYTHVFDRATGKELGAYAIEEALDERFAFGFGDLSVHEWATDATESLGYIAYYSGGIRVAQFGEFGIRETGKFIDVGGSNFWGVEQFNGPGDRERLIAGSDRDYGLYILRYTGPGAAQAPACEDALVFTEAGASATVPLACGDANGNVLTRTIADAPDNGTVTITGDRAEYTPNDGFTGEDRFVFRASDGSLVSEPAQVRVLVGRCSNAISGTDADDVIDGTAFADSIKAGAGDDVVSAAQGDDCADGEGGNDEIVGSQGKDLLLGGLGDDRLFGDSEDDVLVGGAGRDHLRGGSGDDALRGGKGADYLSGGSNDDRIVGGPGRDSIRGNAGDDTIRAGGGRDAIAVGKGTNRVKAGSGRDRINAVNGRRDSISCGKGRDVVRADPEDRVGASCEKVLVARRKKR